MENDHIYRIDIKDLNDLFSAFQEDGYTVVGPKIKDQAIVYEELDSIDDLPIGWTDDQQPGTYRIKRRNDKALFGYNVGPHSWKKYLFPPRRKLWEAKRDKESITFAPESTEAKKIAFLGIRSCEIEAIFIQDKVFIEGKFVDTFYKNQRDNTLIIAVNCTQAAPTCFCASMNTGPEAKRGFDLSLTEIINEKDHYFVVAIGSEKGKSLIGKIKPPPCEQDDITAANEGIDRARKQMDQGLGIDNTDINNLLYRNMENPRWDEVAKRCLSCANCTLVCPTCFCSNTEDITDLTGDHTERWKTWDSCFNQDHSYLYGGAVRDSTKSRYRQWLTHKLGSWIDQFGTSGCVGCGRCVTWCPVGIDLREEVAAIRLKDEREEKE